MDTLLNTDCRKNLSPFDDNFVPWRCHIVALGPDICNLSITTATLPAIGASSWPDSFGSIREDLGPGRTAQADEAGESGTVAQCPNFLGTQGA